MNKNLNVKNPSDEFYTTEDSAGYLFQQVKLDDFANKVVYCNCDGPESEIYKWLKKRYSELKLKSLYATKYVRDGRGVKTTFDGEQEVVSELVGDGDCFSDECKKLLDECDVVCTNPPFSRLDELIPMLFEHNKDFVIIANMMCVMHKPIAKYTLSGRINGLYPIIPPKYKGGNGWSFLDATGKLAYVWCSGLTTLVPLPTSRKLPSLTTAELAKKKRLHYEDTTKEMVVDYVRNIPTDLEGTCLVPMTVCLTPEVKQKYEILGFTRTCVVDGKARFYRVRIMKKEDK